MSRKKFTPGRCVNGVLLLDKPAGITSNAALQQVKSIYFAKKAGHTGSLDPLATGMLPLCFGEATKFSQFLLDSDKKYIVTGKLGERTDTSDADGEIIEVRDIKDVTESKLLQIIETFKGPQTQVPSMFSAIKHEGTPLYELARKGIEVERKPRQINVYDMQLLSLTTDSFELSIHCSKGTYVRNLVEDIGEVLGCGAHVAKLRRTSAGSCEAENMVTMEQLQALFADKNWDALNDLLLPTDIIVAQYPEIALTETASFYLKRGQAVQIPKAPRSGLVRLRDENNEFIGVGDVQEDGKIAPKRLTSSF